MSGFDHKKLDEVIHGRVRLAVMSYLMTARSADFTELKSALEVSDGNLSTHLKKLEDAGFVLQEKSFAGRKPQTTVRLTEAGDAAFRRYLEEIAAMLGTGRAGE
ncbi:winged helix-turn-helix domain-containing protein [Gimibacter soli]|uniref:Transcriptional regulator n=1 Tax=Gimibacter soli TaxID=3024400 RepID=A0AAE9XQJ6_9PROT|nr:transcriptional regulator [Gimibacter soli]WCL54536.1 transcriptional regulator [Gimibacter soli]